jgi:pyruvate/2-oxoglutarate dehydrogenase complex dihydrolipoamide dehydrogenase (E3) component
MSRKPHLKNGILQADLCVIGAGSGGLSVAAGAAQMGAAVVLIEKHLMGGDCLNTGCVPSKALLAAAHAAQAQRSGGRFGVAPVEPRVDFTQVMAHVHGVIGAIAPHDSVARFEGLGCSVIQATARFTGPGEVEAGGQRIAARRFIIATGSRAALPPIPGLAETPHLTNETLFGLRELPRRVQFQRLGATGGEFDGEIARQRSREQFDIGRRVIDDKNQWQTINLGEVQRVVQNQILG